MECKDGSCKASIRMPGGVTINYRGLSGTEAYYRATQGLQVLMAPIRIIFDLMMIFIKLRDALLALNLSSLDKFKEKFQDVVVALTKLGQYYPSVAVPILILDSLKFMICQIEMIEKQIENIEKGIDKLNQISSKLERDAELQSVMNKVHEQNNKQLKILQCMIGPIQQITDILNKLSELIGGLVDIPEISNDDLDGIKEGLSDVKEAIQSIIDYMEGN